MTLQSYRIIPEKQEKSVNACALFYGMCQNPNCVNLTLEKGDTPMPECITLTFYIKKCAIRCLLSAKGEAVRKEVQQARLPKNEWNGILEKIFTIFAYC